MQRVELFAANANGWKSRQRPCSHIWFKLYPKIVLCWGNILGLGLGSEVDQFALVSLFDSFSCSWVQQTHLVVSAHESSFLIDRIVFHLLCLTFGSNFLDRLLSAVSFRSRLISFFRFAVRLIEFLNFVGAARLGILFQVLQILRAISLRSSSLMIRPPVFAGMSLCLIVFLTSSTCFSIPGIVLKKYENLFW